MTDRARPILLALANGNGKPLSVIAKPAYYQMDDIHCKLTGFYFINLVLSETC